MRRKGIFEVLNRATQYLNGCGILNPRRESEILLCHGLGCEPKDLYVDFGWEFDSRSLDEFQRLLPRRGEGQPLQYLIGIAQFMGLDFLCSPGVFIPRPETEILVETVSERIPEYKTSTCVIFDLGTGCGNIAVSIAKISSNALVFASDISQTALNIAMLNVRRHRIEKKVHLFRGDLFEPLKLKKVDLIISNPPYIRSNDLKDLPREVKYEPQDALDGGRNGLTHLKRIVEESPRYLRSGGYLALEVGDGQAHRVSKIIRRTKRFVDVKIIKDYNKIDRVIVAKNSERT